MLDEKKIVFVTTTLYTKWLSYQQALVRKHFPHSRHIVVDGTGEWPDVWSNWIPHVKATDAEYYCHIDEDFFITNRYEMLEAFQVMEDTGVDLVGVPDGMHHYRGGSPIAMNAFLMFGRVSKLREIDLTGIRYHGNTLGWGNNLGHVYRPEYGDDFHFPFPSQGPHDYHFGTEPYYAFFWALKSKGAKFHYLFPYFDERYKSTNPRMRMESRDLGIHMWYTRCWASDMDVWGMRNCDRYTRIYEDFLRFV